MLFCTLPEIGDPGLLKFLNNRGFLLELDEEKSPETFRFCASIFPKVKQMVAALDHLMIHRNRIRPIHLGLTECRLTGAFSRVAFKPMEYDFIGIDHGTIANAVELFNRILAHPENLPTIGDPLKEEAPLPVEHTVSALRDKAYRKWVKPKCPVRRYFAQSLIYIGLELIILHELAHHANGHIDYLNEIGKSPVIDQPYSWNDSERILRQTLEMDADATSVKWALQINAAKLLGLDTSPCADSDQRVARGLCYGTIPRIVSSILYAGYALLRANSKPWDSAYTENDNLHPPSSTRLKFLADGLHENIRNTRGIGYTVEQYRSNQASVVAEIETAFSRIGGGPVNLEIFDSVFNSPKSEEYFFDLERKWAEIKPNLERHMKVGMLSPVDWGRIPPVNTRRRV
jgi:hypothetical protein